MKEEKVPVISYVLLFGLAKTLHSSHRPVECLALSLHHVLLTRFLLPQVLSFNKRFRSYDILVLIIRPDNIPEWNIIGF